MRDFRCTTCGQRLAFENSVCLSCSARLGFSPTQRAVLVIDQAGPWQLCDNLHVAECNWLVPAGPPQLCESCRLTRTRPQDADAAAMVAFADAEAAKRRLVFELIELGLPIVERSVDPFHGLAFDLLSSNSRTVITGHESGIITLDLAEGDDVHRTRLRRAMDEPYRTLLGHFRHEIGHYFYPTMITDGTTRAQFVSLFGDPTADYQSAVDRHYRDGAPAGWESDYVSSYCTMHPAEDWAETFAHYLHMRDTLDTAAAYRLTPAHVAFPLATTFDKLIDEWIPLAWELNMLNRSMGHDDLYPFVLPDKVLEKMRFAHDRCTQLRQP